MKRVMDVVGALLGVLLLFPVLLLIACWVLLADGRPVFYRQWRVGRHSHPFRIWKFRTMAPDAERQGLPLTVGRDPRITRSGAWLRQSKLDELPQLFNVLAGEMSLVGPRPEVARYTARYTPEQQRVLELTPGITDPASIRYRDENALLAGSADPEQTYITHIMPEKIRLNLEYATQATPVRDLLVILHTIRRLARRS